ncbi:MAG: hypothetical protein ACREV4_11095 [Gammaproteobacteria bacterium]
MTETLSHRCPDSIGYFNDGAIVLGHTRLSIIDLEGGKQPISNETDSIFLICNGEIYNSPELRDALIRRGHTFKTRCRSNSASIRRIWPGLRQTLAGMFAFAIWALTPLLSRFSIRFSIRNLSKSTRGPGCVGSMHAGPLEQLLQRRDIRPWHGSAVQRA